MSVSVLMWLTVITGQTDTMHEEKKERDADQSDESFSSGHWENTHWKHDPTETTVVITVKHML